MKATSHMVGVGVDVVEMADIHNARFKKRFADYFLTKREQRAIPKNATNVQHLASRFALKEAVIKALPEKITPLQFEIRKKGTQPVIVFKRATLNKKYSVLVSMTHTTQSAVGVAVVLDLIDNTTV